MNAKQQQAYKAAASFYLSSTHDDWSGERIRKAVLADIDCDDDQAISDQRKIKVWEPIESHLDDCHPASSPGEELDSLIQNLAKSFLMFANTHGKNPIRMVVVEHEITPLNDNGKTYPATIIPAKHFGQDFLKFQGLTLTHDDGATRDGTPVRFKQTFLRTRKTDEELLEQYI
jgi:hypothetical protein